MMEKEVQQIPMEWIDKLFNCMEQFYGSRWSKPLEKPHMMDFNKTVWQSGLCGLNYEQIKSQLIKCKKHSESISAIPPLVMDFYRYAKENIENNAPTHVSQIVNSVVARKHMDDIKQKLNMTTER